MQEDSQRRERCRGVEGRAGESRRDPWKGSGSGPGKQVGFGQTEVLGGGDHTADVEQQSELFYPERGPEGEQQGHQEGARFLPSDDFLLFQESKSLGKRGEHKAGTIQGARLGSRMA